MIERRRFNRIDCNYRVNYATHGMASIISSSTAINVSKVGIRLPMSRLVHKGAVVSLAIFTEIGQDPVPATGKVRWTREFNSGSKLSVEAGIEIFEIEPADSDRLIAPRQ